jgi:hypothetical protein
MHTLSLSLALSRSLSLSRSLFQTESFKERVSKKHPKREFQREKLSKREFQRMTTSTRRTMTDAADNAPSPRAPRASSTRGYTSKRLQGDPPPDFSVSTKVCG